jgi:glycine cleavage system aminomethyltransferase T
MGLGTREVRSKSDGRSKSEGELTSFLPTHSAKPALATASIASDDALDSQRISHITSATLSATAGCQIAAISPSSVRAK